MGTLSNTYPNSVAVEEALNRANRAEVDIISIKERLENLEYDAAKINRFTANPSLCEMGSSNTIDLEWNTNKPSALQTINGVEVEGSSKQYTGITATTTFSLVISDDKTTAIKDVDVVFANQIYYGTATSLSNVTSLPSVLSNDKTRTFTVAAGAGQYIVYAIPKRLGTVVFYVGGFEGGFETPAEQTLQNNSGYGEVYYVYRSTNANLGNTTIEVKEV